MNQMQRGPATLLLYGHRVDVEQLVAYGIARKLNYLDAGFVIRTERRTELRKILRAMRRDLELIGGHPGEILTHSDLDDPVTQRDERFRHPVGCLSRIARCVAHQHDAARRVGLLDLQVPKA